MTTLEIQSIQSAAAATTDIVPPVLHSHHYHAALLRMLYEANDLDAAEILTAAVVASAREGSSTVNTRRGRDGVWSEVIEAFRLSGMGRLDLSGLDGTGEGDAFVDTSHFALAWSTRYPPAAHPVCGVAAASISTLLTRYLGTQVEARETSCVAQGAERCGFRIRRQDGVSGVRRKAGHVFDPQGPTLDFLEASDGLIGEIFSGGLRADDRGQIVAPGGPFVRLPAEFYAGVTYGFEREVPRVRGAKFSNLPTILLLEAAHRNGFHLFGEILRSAAWTERVAPCLATDDETLGCLFGVMGALGWGSWEIVSFVPGERLIARVPDSYEALGHLELFGRARVPRCHVARGAAAAVMNLLFRGDGAQGPELTASHYNGLFRSPSSFRAVETRCVATGDSFCEIVANPLSL